MTRRERGIALHREGRLADAEEIYAEVLRENPADFEVLHLQGVIAHESGRHQQALDLIGRAIALRRTAETCVSLGAALSALGRHAEALASFDEALTLQPACVEAHNYRGMALQQLRRTAEALTSFERALALRPDAAELHNNRGNVLRRLQRFAEALESYERAIALRGDFAAAYNNRGLVLQALGRYSEAAVSYEHAVALRADFAEAHNNLGTVLCELGRPAEALSHGRRALELQPGMRGVNGNLGNALRDLQRPEEALAAYELALQEAPHDATAHCHRGNALFDLKCIADAIASYDRAIELNPHHVLAHFNKGLCLLLCGEFAPGLPLYEWRSQLRPPAALPSHAEPWLGKSPIAGKTLYVYADQALGDTIQFCRYARLAEERGAQVVLAVQPQLRELLTTLSPSIRIVATGEPPEACDYHCALMSLPLAFATTLADIPARVPYLSADPQRVARWRERLGAAGLKVGIVWQGSRNRIDIGRSAPLEMFVPLAGIPGVRLISLQKGGVSPELRSRLPLEVLGEDYDSGPQAFLDSAAVMMHLDLVITCDTALAHLAGALGRPTWAALKHVPDWRWLLERTDCPWYPSMRLLRQSRRGDWDEVFTAIHAQLARLARAAPAGAR